MVDVSRKACEKNGIETIVDSDGILRLNEKHIEEGNLLVTIVNYPSAYRKHRYELVDEPKKEPNKIFKHNELGIKVIMDCRTTAAHKFRARLGLKQ